MKLEVDMILRPLCALFLLVFLCSQRSVVAWATLSMRDVINTCNRQEKNLQEAQRLWELALAAKGGRERLYAVRNIVTSSHAEYTTSSRRKNQIRQEELFVFPSKLWFWNDLRPDVFGLTVEMYDYDTNMHYAISPDDPHSQPRPLIGNLRTDSIMFAQIFFLLESKWVKPALLRVTTERIGLQTVDTVQTAIDDKRVDFAFDRQTHLPIRITRYHMRVNKEILDDVIGLSDYTEVSGIRVPRTLKYEDGPEYTVSVQFNVDYNPEIFVNPPPIEAGPEAWRPKK